MKALARDAVRYFGVSLLALGVDYGLLVALHRAAGLHYLVAASLSFVAGLVVAWTASAAFVFNGRRKLSRTRELIGFAVTGIAGLVLTQLLMMLLVDRVGVAPELAKIPVAGCVFVFNFVSRRALLFAPAATA